MNACLKINGSVVGNVKDVTVNLEAGEADVTTRGNQGWRATAPTLRECNVDFEMQWKPSDAAFSAVKTAFLTSGTVEMEVLDQPAGEGPHGNFSITNFSRSEPLEEALSVSVTAKLAEFIEWLEGTGTAT
jgi:hypothetical protein